MKERKDTERFYILFPWKKLSTKHVFKHRGPGKSWVSMCGHRVEHMLWDEKIQGKEVDSDIIHKLRQEKEEYFRKGKRSFRSAWRFCGECVRKLEGYEVHVLGKAPASERGRLPKERKKLAI